MEEQTKMSSLLTARFLCFVLLFAMCLVQLFLFTGVGGEDCYITYRYARNLVLGDGLVYNPGEYVEGISNPYWAFCLAGLFALGVPPDTAGAMLAILHGCAGFLVLCRVSRRLFQNAPWFSLLAPVLVVCLTEVPASYQNGLEGSAAGLAAMMMCAGFATTSPAWLVSGLVLMLGNRPEAPAYAALVLFWLGMSSFTGGISPRRGAFWAGAVILLVGGMVAVRYWYYGDIVPNTMRAKAGVPFGQTLWPGLRYLRDYVLLLGPWMLVIALFSPFKRGWGLRCVFLAAMVALNMAVVVRNGGDWMSNYRLMTPFFGVVALLISSGFYVIWEKCAGKARFALVTAFVAGALLMVNFVELGAATRRIVFTWPHLSFMPLSDDYQVDNHVSGSLLAREKDDLLLSDCGGLPAFLLGQPPVLELFGLTDRELASSESPCGFYVPAGGRINWHAALVTRRPTYMLFAWGYMADRLLDVVNCPETAPALERYVIAQNNAELEGSFNDFYIRSDRASLREFIRDFGAFAPVSDVAAYLRNHPDTPRNMRPGITGGVWARPPWTDAAGGAVLADEWRDWNGRRRYCSEIRLKPGENRFVRPQQDGAPLLLSIDLPPGSSSPAEIVFKRTSASTGEVVSEWHVGTAGAGFSAEQHRCFYGFMPETGDGGELILESAVSGETTACVGVYRWCRGETPPLPKAHVYPDKSDYVGMIRQVPRREYFERCAEIFQKENDIDGLRREWAGLIKDRRFRINAVYHIGVALETAGRFPEAIQEYQKLAVMDSPVAVFLKSPWMPSILSRPTAFLLSGFGVETKSYLYLARTGEGRALAALGKIEEAKEAFRAAMDNEPSEYGAYAGLTNIYMARGDLNGLRAEWEAAVARAPERMLNHFCLGFAFEVLHLRDEARRCYERALELEPGAEGTLEALRRLQ